MSEVSERASASLVCLVRQGLPDHAADREQSVLCRQRRVRRRLVHRE